MNRPAMLTFTTEQEVACARSACRRLLATPTVHLTERQRAALTDLLTELTTVGVETGQWSVPCEPDRMRALYFAAARQQRQLTAAGEQPKRGSALAAFNNMLRQLAVFDTWPLARAEVVQFVRLGFGDGHGLPMRSLDFEVGIPDRITLEVALIDGIVGYNRMNGVESAKVLGPLWDEMGTVTLGRRSDPIMRIQLPYTHQQRNGGNNARCTPLSGEEFTDLVTRLMAAGKACTATPLLRSHDNTPVFDGAPQTPPGRPSELLLLWQS